MFGFLTDFTLRNVVLGATVLGVISGTLGAFALLRRQSLLGDALSHAALPGICIGFLITGSRQTLPILLGALVAGVLAALVMLVLTRRTRTKEDAALGAVLSVFFALGTVLLTYIQRGNDAGQAGLDTFLFGQAAAILPGDILAMAVIAALASGFVLLFWKEIKLVTFDPGFAGSIGLPVVAFDLALTALVAFAVVIGLQMVGVILMSAMLIAPAAAARQWSNRLGVMVTLSAAFAVASGVAGAMLSATGEGLATGPIMVLCATLLVVVSLLMAPGRGVLWGVLTTARNRRRLEAHTVLLDVYRLAEHHENPDHRSELGTIDALRGPGTKRALRALTEKGWLRPVDHMVDEGRHWMLTEAGRAEAEKILQEVERGRP